jgi:hypothetical protein
MSCLVSLAGAPLQRPLYGSQFGAVEVGFGSLCRAIHSGQERSLMTGGFQACSAVKEHPLLTP